MHAYQVEHVIENEQKMTQEKTTSAVIGKRKHYVILSTSNKTFNILLFYHIVFCSDQEINTINKTKLQRMKYFNI
jgi:hypothetical protein